MRKTNYITAAAVLAAFFMLQIIGLTAYASPLDEASEVTIVTGGIEPTVADEAPELSEAEVSPGIEGIPGIDEAPHMEESPDTEEAFSPDEALLMEPDEMIELPPLPHGAATVINYNTDPNGRLFYTIMTPDEHVFYLVIDKSSNTDNVYFLNAVTVADLLALAEAPEQMQSGTVTPPTTTTNTPEQPTETPPPTQQPQSGNNTGMYIIIGILVIIGGGAGWYFKIYRPKQQGMSSGEEYDPSLNEYENDYDDDWGEASDGGNDSGDGVGFNEVNVSDDRDYFSEVDVSDNGDDSDDDYDDSPPWYEDNEDSDESAVDD